MDLRCFRTAARCASQWGAIKGAGHRPRELCPGGTSGNSPAFQRRGGQKRDPRPEGTTENTPCFQPSLRDAPRFQFADPALKRLSLPTSSQRPYQMFFWVYRARPEGRRWQAASGALGTPTASLSVGKGVALRPPPPRCRDRVYSLYLPACRFQLRATPVGGAVPRRQLRFWTE